MGNALGQVWSIFQQEQERQRQIVRGALDAVSFVSSPDTADAALERLRSGLEASNARLTQPQEPLPVDLTESQADWLRENSHMLAGSHKNGRMQ